MSALISITTYLNDMLYWIERDIERYKSFFPDAIAVGLYDYTPAPGTRPSPQFQQPGNLTIPLAGAILSCMDFCGFCLRAAPKEHSKSQQNIQEFYKAINGQTSAPLPSDQDILDLIRTCRHGFAHKFFPKQEMGVGYYKSTEDLFINIPDGKVLNTNALIQHITQGLRYLINNTSLHASMETCYHQYLVDMES